MISVLAVGLDCLMLKKDSVRGDVRERQFDYAKQLGFLTLVVYSPKQLCLKAQQWSDNLWIYPTNSKSKTTFIIDAYKAASRICKERKIDVITVEDPFTTGFIGYLLKKKFSIPLNVQSHVDFCDNQYWMGIRSINKLFNQLGKLILRHADTIRVGTNYEKEKISKKLNISKDKIFVIPVNSEIDKFKNADGSKIRDKYINDKFDKLLIFTGRLVDQKDIITLLKAFSLVVQRIPKTLLLIVGSGNQGMLLRRLATELELNDNVIFTGSIEHGKVSEYIAACDIYTISSIFEGTCIAMVEAMVAGKPVVATRFAGANDLVIDGETGYLIEQKDYNKFAEAIIMLLNNPELSKEMGRKGAKRIDELFSGNQNIDKVIRLWEKTASLKA